MPRLPTDVDVVIVGGGYTGVMAAARLAWHGRAVALLEKNELGSGASSRNGGMVHPGFKLSAATLLRRFGERGRALYQATLDAFALVEQTIARNIDRQMSHRSAARSVSALAAMLAHEVKNPLSGIRGAAQLLEQSVPDSERELTSLICEETDRIVALVDRMEAFADGRPIERGPINIHQVLNHVRGDDAVLTAVRCAIRRRWRPMYREFIWRA